MKLCLFSLLTVKSHSTSLLENLEELLKTVIKSFTNGGMADKLMYPAYVSVLGIIWYYMGVFIFILMFQYLFSSTFKKAAYKAVHQSLKSALLGILFFTVVPCVIFLLMNTLVGIPLGLLILLVYIILLLLVIFISSVSVANWINTLGKYHWNFWVISLLALAVFLMINFLLMVPILGISVLGILACLAVGSILSNINWKKVKAI